MYGGPAFPISSGGGGGSVTAINNATANELVTIGATTTELDAEGSLTWDTTMLDASALSRTFANNTQTLNLYSSTAEDEHLGGGIAFGGVYDAGGNKTVWSAISGRKENTTAGQTGGYLQMGTRANGENIIQHMRIDSSGLTRFSSYAGAVDITGLYPYTFLHVGSATPSAVATNALDGAVGGFLLSGHENGCRAIFEGPASSGIITVDTGAGSNLKAMTRYTDGGFTHYYALNDNASVKHQMITFNHDTGHVGINDETPESQLSIIGLPTEEGSLKAGSVYNDSGTLKIVE